MTRSGFTIDEAVIIAAPAEHVWRALVDDPVRESWWPYLRLDATVGGTFEETWTDAEGRLRRTQGTITELVPHRLLRLDWADRDWEAVTDVQITLEELGDVDLPTGDQPRCRSTNVRVRHVGWELLPNGPSLVEEHQQGWRMHLSNLRNLWE